MLYPITTKSRTVCSLDGIWKFKLDNDNGFYEQWYMKELTDAVSMPVPASYNDIYDDLKYKEHYGYVFYQRNLSIPSELLKHRLVLRFEAVTNEAVVYINGEQVVKHKGGFLPFEVEINDKVVEGENLLTVAVGNVIDNTTLPVGGENDMFSGMFGPSSGSEKKKNNPNFDFFNYCGITRSVKLYTTPFEYIEDVFLVCDFTDEEYNSVNIGYEIKCNNYKGKDTKGNSNEKACGIAMVDKEGNIVAKHDGLSGSINLENPKLWQPGKAYLYKVVAWYGEDIYILPYGIREVKLSEKRFLINGKPFYFKGYGKHEDTFPNGRGENNPMNCKDVALMKWQNANSFRTSHYPYSEEMMRLCDEEGIVVIDETPAVGINYAFGGGANFNGQKVSTYDKDRGVKTFEHHKDVIKDMIDRDKNYACVVMWSIANEPDATSEGAYEYFKPLFDLARECDLQRRPCTMVSVQIGTNPGNDVSARLSDVICLNRYYGWYFAGGDFSSAKKNMISELDEWSKIGKPLMFTEYGADTVAGFHEIVPVMYTEEYQVDFYKINNEVLDMYDFVIGEQIWNFADFATSPSILRVGGNRKGVFTRDRKPKMAAYYLKERWGNIPDFGYKK